MFTPEIKREIRNSMLARLGMMLTHQVMFFLATLIVLAVVGVSITLKPTIVAFALIVLASLVGYCIGWGIGHWQYVRNR